MEAWVGLVGVVIGAIAAVYGQHLLGRSDRRDVYRREILTQCAQVAALSEDFRNRVWEERKLGRVDTVSQWDIPTYKLAEAQLRILNPDPALTACLLDLAKTGRELGRAWRPDGSDDAVVERAWVAHKESLDKFLTTAAKVDADNR